MQIDLQNPANSKVFLLFLVLGFLLYGNTLGHEFALDDAIVVTDNEFTKKGFSGIWDQLSNDQFVGFYGQKKDLVSGGRYRPLSMVVFNIQYGLFGKSAFIGHLTNVLFYILNGFLLFLVLNRLLVSYAFKHRWISFSLLASLLWFFHPIHTEVVANIKGLDEIMAFGFDLVVMLFLLKFLDSKKVQYLLLLALCYFLALLSKENAITWMAIFPLAVFLFSKHSLKKAILPLITLLGVAFIWFWIRYQVVGGGISDVADNLMNDPFIEATISDKYATILLTLGKYIQLLVFPHPLTYDYYPKHIPIVGWNNPLVILSVVTYIFLCVMAVKGLLAKKLYSFVILIFLIPLSIASNLLFPIGAFMNERFVYVSSIGIAIVIAYYLLQIGTKTSKNTRTTFNVLLLLILSLYSVKTISRNLVWKNNLTLSTSDANISVNGAKSNVMAGGILSEEAVKLTDPAAKKAMLEQSIFYLNRALRIYPEYIDALILMGNAQFDFTQEPRNAIPYYQKIISINPYHVNTWQNIFIVLEQSKDVDYRIQTYETLLRYNPSEDRLYLNLGRAYGKEKNDLSNALKYFEKGISIAPNNHDLLTNLGTVYGLQQDYVKAIKVLEKAILIQPTIAKTYIDLGLSYFYAGQQELAKQTFDKAAELDNTLNRSQFPV